MELERIIMSEVTETHKDKGGSFSHWRFLSSKSSDVCAWPAVTTETRKVKWDRCQDRRIGKQQRKEEQGRSDPIREMARRDSFRKGGDDKNKHRLMWKEVNGNEGYR